MDFLDGYVIRARLFPAMLGIAPALVFLLVTIGDDYKDLALPEVLMTLTVGVLFFAFADIARRFGRRAERKLFWSSNGRPFPSVLRYRDTTLNARSKARILEYVAGQLGKPAPTFEEEHANPARADDFYVSCGDFLRERMRDQSRFSLLFAENISYGFRRNLYGLRYPGLALNVLTVAGSIWFVYRAAGENLAQYGVVLVVAAIHALYFIFSVTRGSVIEAADTYSRQLVLSGEDLIRAA
jgi:hypothetical protein